MTEFDYKLFNLYDSFVTKERELNGKIADLPKGSIQIKHINGADYAYLQYRDGGKVKSTYVKSDDIQDMEALIKERKEIEKELREIRETKAQLFKALGKYKINILTIQKAVFSLANTYPICAATLVGERVGKRFRQDSEIELLMDFSEEVKPDVIDKIINYLEFQTGATVDLIWEPIRKYNYRVSDKQIDIFKKDQN